MSNNLNNALHMATEEQRKAEENVLWLVEEQKREKEVLLKNTLKLERGLDEQQKLDMEIEELKGNLEVMNNMGDDDDDDDDLWAVQKKIDWMNEMLQEFYNDLNVLENLNNNLLALQDNNDLDGLQELNNHLRTVERQMIWDSTH